MSTCPPCPPNTSMAPRYGDDRQALREEELRNVATGMRKLFAPASDNEFADLIAAIERSALRRRRG